MTGEASRPWVARPVRWEVRYPLEVEPLGEIVLDGLVYRGRFRQEDLGHFDSGDEAAAAVWERFLDHVRVRHDVVSRLHGGAERHAG